MDLTQKGAPLSREVKRWTQVSLVFQSLLYAVVLYLQFVATGPAFGPMGPIAGAQNVATSCMAVAAASGLIAAAIGLILARGGHRSH